MEIHESLSNQKIEKIETLKQKALPSDSPSCIDSMQKQLKEEISTEKSSVEIPLASSYSLFNKNFTTFIKYTDSNLDINMAVSSANSNKMSDFVKNDEQKMLLNNNNNEVGLNDMLAATSLTKNSFTKKTGYDKELICETNISLKRQNNCLNQLLIHSDNTNTDMMSGMVNENVTESQCNIAKQGKEHLTLNKTKAFCSNSSSASSTCSNSSFSSKSSSRTDSNETPKLALQNNQISRQLHNFSTHQNNKRHNCGDKPSSQKYSSSSSSNSSTSSANSIATKTFSPWNIENELIKYTKNLKLDDRSYLETYKLGAHIRNGGFSEIYEGNHLENQSKEVIIKLIPKKKTKNWLMVHNKKYPAEILLHKMCNHINGVVEMIEFFEQKNDWVIIMPKVQNCMDLFDYLESKQRGRLSEEEACNFFIQLVKINLELLNHGVVHRDIKSENILIDLNTMKLILIDFGASAICRTKNLNSSTQHHYSDFHGTRQYKPPEYITHKKYTAIGSTIWTLGILLFDMCNGQLPFETEDEITENNLQMKAPVSEEYKKIINDCLKLNPAERPSLNQLLEYSWCVKNAKIKNIN